MKLISARVENYKIIEDSTEFSVDQVTCLVGKNESGKSAILEALYKLKPVEADESGFEDFDYPRRRFSAASQAGEVKKANVLTTVWELDDDDVAAVAAALGGDFLRSNTVTVTKGYSNKRSWSVELDERALVAHELSASSLEGDEAKAASNAVSIYWLIDHLERLSEKSDAQAGLLAALTAKYGGKWAPSLVHNLLAKRLPTFVYFTDYYRMPGRAAVAEIQRLRDANNLGIEDKVFLSFLKLANASLEEFDQAGTSEELIVKLEAVSNRITDEIFEFWTQNKHLEVEFRFDQARPEDPAPYNSGYVFNTRIKNTRHRASVNFDERSTGFIWFFSFLVWFSQVKEEYGENLLILLDEPGLALHAKAQGDLLRYINERLRPNYQVVYSTHSPFMIDPENLLSVRTVEDRVSTDARGRETVEGTKVGDRVLGVDADTVLPLYGALGYDITQTLFVGANTLLVEGPSDILYLKAMSSELGKLKRTTLDQRWTLAPAGGLDKVMSFVILFSGKRLHVAVLTDLQQGDKAKIRRLREMEILKEGHVLSADMYVEQDEADIEDLFGRDAYAALVNAAYGLAKSKALPAKRPAGAPERCVKEAAERVNLDPTKPEFDHYTPAQYLAQNLPGISASLPGWNDALGRFEKLFRDLNRLL